MDAELGYEPLKAIEGGMGGCMCCGYQHSIFPMEAVIAVGFGCAQVTKDGAPVYDETDADDMNFMTGEGAEALAAADPKHDWRIHMVAPLSERHYQRQGEKHWVLYERGQGFA